MQNAITGDLAQLNEWKAAVLAVASALSDEQERPELVADLLKVAKTMAEREAALWGQL